ncbi:MAG: hypothetical protein JW772_02090 [Candidatus Diapherotrites archaeon]|nr:hypothetical protein [Candidatus Diapherotrites archaeon]
MHDIVFQELQRMDAKKELKIRRIVPEKTTFLQSNGTKKQGRFDFFVEANGKCIGIEVLTRPSHGKLKEKIVYAHDVDEFIFAIPETAFELYKKPCGKGHKRARPNFFSQEFAQPKLRAWLLNLSKNTVEIKSCFNKIFNVKC